MDNSYLFFDIECANCFNGEGKMCSFGYVLTDADFNILDSQDLVMNPETEFDWYLFSNKNGCSLAYSKDYFRMQHPFPDYYKGVKKLMTAPSRKVIGFSSKNDLGFVVTACERYDLPVFNFATYDVAKILEKLEGKTKKLHEWGEYFNIKTDKLVAHKSCDDAMMTMLVLQELCKKHNLSIEEILEKNRESHLSVEKYAEQRELKRHNDEVGAKIKDLYGKKSKCPYSKSFSGSYTFGFKIFNDVDLSYDIAQLLYKHGGMLVKRLQKNGTIIMDDSQITPELIEKMKKDNLTVISIDDFYNKIPK